ncbi:MAG: oligosaccharide flippase family protein [Melioribacter sp.]|nr:oligosaccharide flippase family protein [Melioribacter sp.]
METFNTSRVVARNSVFRLLTYGITLIATLFYIRFVVKYLGIEVYGLWGLASLVISTSNLINFGFTIALTKETAYIDGGNKNYSIIKFLIKGYDLFYILAGIITLPIILGFKSSIVQHIFGVKDIQQGAVLAYLIGAMVPLTVVYMSAMSRRAVVEGFQEIHYSSMISLLGRLINFALSILLIFVGIGVWSLYTASLVENFILFFAFSRRISKKLKNQGTTSYYFQTKPRLRELVIKNLIYGFNLQVSSIASMGLEFFYKIFVTRIFGLESVGYFQIAWRAQQMLHGILSSGMSPLFPASAFHIAKGNALELKGIYKKSTKYAWFFTFGVFLIFVLFSGEILKLWLGQTSPFLVFTFQMLCAGLIFTSLSTPAYMFILGSGKSEYITFTQLLFAIVSLATSFIIIYLQVTQLNWMSVGISYLLGAIIGFVVISGGVVKIFRWNIMELLFDSLPSLRFSIIAIFLGILVIIFNLEKTIQRSVNGYVMLFIVLVVFIGLLIIEIFREERGLKNIIFSYLWRNPNKVSEKHELK